MQSAASIRTAAKAMPVILTSDEQRDVWMRGVNVLKLAVRL